MHTVFLFGISGGEILIILLVVLILFGPSKIPEMARLIGRGVNEVKKVQREINTEIQRYSAEVEKEARKIKTDIDELKTEVKKAAEVDEAQTNAYNYDHYGLDDEYSKSVGQPRSADQTSDAVTLDYDESVSDATGNTTAMSDMPSDSQSPAADAENNATRIAGNGEDDITGESAQETKKPVVKKKREKLG
jgi:TatA/E family protein of Tat protein translocase